MIGEVRIKGDYHRFCKRRLLATSDRLTSEAANQLRHFESEQVVQKVANATSRNFEQLLTELPFIGGIWNQFTIVMILNAWIISYYRAMKEQGKTVEDVIRVSAELADRFFQSLPDLVKRLAKRAAFSRAVRWWMGWQARRSQKRRYREDFVYELVEGDGETFDWALSFSECAVQKLYDAQGVDELKPFCNFFDVTYSRHLDMGANANVTIGAGCPHCLLAFKKGRETLIPARLKGLMPRT